jgi:hypothetical protein
VNAYNKDHQLSYTVTTHLYPEVVYKKWFRDWAQAHPDQLWRQIAALPYLNLVLYELPQRLEF